ncbi:MAG: TylF/MycF family methyltransferase [Cyclobacteriaceae bacterium]|nr:TylF/MycF family methyltransferase [Cyclobacteriaceae bacterium]
MNMIKRSLLKLFSLFGYSVIRKQDRNLGLEPRIEKEVLDHTMVTLPALRNIIETTQYILDNAIGGSFVECGVWKGGSVALMAYVLKKGSDYRPIHLFDAFDDICEPDAAVDGERAILEVGGKHNATGKLNALKGIYDVKGGHGDELKVQNLLTNSIGYPLEKLVFHKGWFQDTVPMNTIDKIALLRLDGDWYASTKVCLEHLYDKVVDGGVIIIDDYYTYEGCSKAVNEFWNLKKFKPFTIKVSNDCLFWIKSSLL